jgi:hypothetical protein
MCATDPTIVKGRIAAMGYKLLGYVVWRGGRRLVLGPRRRKHRRKLLVGGMVAVAIGAAIGGAVLAQRQPAANEPAR